jgi:hypothetical protein
MTQERLHALNVCTIWTTYVLCCLGYGLSDDAACLVTDGPANDNSQSKNARFTYVTHTVVSALSISKV